jgi:hypothetical protein
MRKHRYYLPVLAVAPVATALIAGQALAATSPPTARAAATAPAPAAFQPLTRAEAARLSQDASSPVIVVLKNQPAQAASGTAAARLRADAVNVSQRPLLNELAQVHAAGVKQFQLVNSVAATVSAGEEARLKTDPQVAEVIPVQTITMRVPAAARPSATSGAPAGGRAASLKANVIPGACPKGRTQLAPEGLALTGTASANPKAATARSLGLTGAGVTVGVISDAVDPDNVNFIRPDGKSAFTDYQDFTGNAPDAPAIGGEGFLDANTIIGQGLHTYDVNGIAAQTYPNACDIRIEGVAPGANLAVFDVSSEDANDLLATTTSLFLQAINYAVETDHVNVLNESFGTNPIPDLAQDAIRKFDDAAVAAGVVVSVSTGDSGPTSTLDSPATDPDVISAGASTQFRLYAQTNQGAARYFAPNGWLSDNISALSSGGFDETGGTVDLVAPGDTSFGSCDADTALFSACVNFTGAASDVFPIAGTSEAAPFVSGAAALVIQAYRETHSGQTPSPALVKQILVSTATDLGAPADEQGAGLLNTYKAVQAAESYGQATRTGQTLLESRTQLNAVGTPGQAKTWQVSVTNTGARPQTVRLSSRAIGADQHVQTGSVTLDDATSGQFTDNTGVLDNFQVFHFTVPQNQDRLDASIAWPAAPSVAAPVNLTLVDPEGKLAAYSIPQGLGNFGNVDVRSPAAGTWTGIIFGVTSKNDGFNGDVSWRVATQQYVRSGTVQPSSLTIASGASKTFSFTAATPSAPGDADAAVVLTPGSGGQTSIPVTLRSQVPVTSSRAGTFSGVLTGGNGRLGGPAQSGYYQFTVPAGVRSITASLTLANDPADPVGAYLISPDGDTLGYGENSLTNPSTGAPESPGTSLTAYTLHPQPGNWALDLQFAQPVTGNETSDPFTGTIAFNTTRATATGLPDTTAPLMRATTATVTVTNTGTAPEQVFLDPRLDKQASYHLAALNGEDTVALPLATAQPTWRVPTETSSITDSQTSTTPAEFDLQPATLGDPDLASGQPGGGPLCGTTATITYTPPGGEVTPGLWTAGPTECGPFTAQALAGSATTAFTITTQAFDGAADGGGITTPTGAYWYGPAFTPVTIQPGKSAEITVTIDPSHYIPGTLVHGTLYIDAYQGSIPAPNIASTIPSADEITSLPYEFTAG